jgi:hypothetical protein
MATPTDRYLVTARTAALARLLTRQQRLRTQKHVIGWPVLCACMHSHPLTPVGGRVVAVSRRSHELNDLRYVHDRRGQRVRRRSAVAPLPEQRGADTAERRRKEA